MPSHHREFLLQGLFRRWVSANARRSRLFRRLGACHRPELPGPIIGRRDAVFPGAVAYTNMAGGFPGAGVMGVQGASPCSRSTEPTAGLERNSPNEFIDMKGQRMAALGVGDTALDCDGATIRPGATEVVCTHRSDAASMPDRRRERVGGVGEKNARSPQSRPPIEILDDGRSGFWRLRHREIA